MHLTGSRRNGVREATSDRASARMVGNSEVTARNAAGSSPALLKLELMGASPVSTVRRLPITGFGIRALFEIVKTAKTSVEFLAHIALKNGRFSLAQIHNHQAIDNIRKFAIEIKAHQSASDLRVLP